MKKIIILLYLIPIFILSACATKSLPTNEIMNFQYAYIVGKLDSRGVDSEWLNGSEKIIIKGKHVVYKVPPGLYHLSAFYIGGNTYNYTNQKPAFFVQAGKINYLGDINLSYSSVTSTYNSDSAKEYIRANYPELSKNLDTQFTTVNLQWVGSD